jgi:hypothetical protein
MVSLRYLPFLKNELSNVIPGYSDKVERIFRRNLFYWSFLFNIA